MQILGNLENGWSEQPPNPRNLGTSTPCKKIFHCFPAAILFKSRKVIKYFNVTVHGSGQEKIMGNASSIQVFSAIYFLNLKWDVVFLQLLLNASQKVT
jgi:hypothetical protein